MDLAEPSPPTSPKLAAADNTEMSSAYKRTSAPSWLLTRHGVSKGHGDRSLWTLRQENPVQPAPPTGAVLFFLRGEMYLRTPPQKEGAVWDSTLG